MPPELDADISSTLTPEELAAIGSEDTPEEHLIMRKGTEGDGDTDTDTDADGDSDDGDHDADDDGGAEDGDGKPADTPSKELAEQPKPVEPQAVAQVVDARYEAALPSDYDDKILAIKDRDRALRQQYKDGEIDIDERDQGLAELSEQREQLIVARTKAEISQEMRAQSETKQQEAAQQTWQGAINSFVDATAKAEGGVDYRKDAAKASDWDGFVRALAAKPEHSDKSMTWFLEEAHKRVLALHGMSSAAAPTKSKKEVIAEAVAKRKPPIASMPKNIADVPGADGPGDVDDQFADVSALDGWELEQAIARMSPAQRAKFARGG